MNGEDGRILWPHNALRPPAPTATATGGELNIDVLGARKQGVGLSESSPFNNGVTVSIRTTN